ncbi:MAG: molybdopterin-dependent oxidoreductase [Verrucomicrobiales bacterium]|nr:molybdopterin-dependent oxidoreductase [Verrucomicrobiales bacterium]
MANLEFHLNGKRVVVDEGAAELEFNLLQFLRQSGWAGTKEVCSEGGCGACTVILSHWDEAKGIPIHRSTVSCLVPLASVHWKNITTIEGLTQLSEKETHPICDAFTELGATQCGFCTPGFIMTLEARLNSDEKLSKKDLERLFDGNLCRCTGYRPILDAAAVFCADPLEDEPRTEDWREDYRQTKRLDDIFPEDYKKPAPGLEIHGRKTSWHLPSHGDEALRPGTQYISGNTDIGYLEKYAFERPAEKTLLAGVPELKEIADSGDSTVIGASVTIEDLYQAFRDGSDSGLRALSTQCRYFANTQVRNHATLGGGLISFNPYGDLIPVWIATRAVLNFRTAKGEEDLAITGPDFSPPQDALLVSVTVPKEDGQTHIESYKYARHRTDSITYVSGAVSARFDPAEETFHDFVIGLSGIGPSGFRAVETEKFLEDSPFDDEALRKAVTVLKSEVEAGIDNPLPGRVHAYQVRISVAILKRFQTAIRKRFLNESIPHEEDLVSRYPEVAHRAQDHFTERNDGILGKAIPHQNSKLQTTGAARYSVDHEVPNCLYGTVIPSPSARGRLLSIDPSEALENPDVIGVYTADDIPGKNLFGFRVEDEEVLASDRVHYAGQPVAILVAKSLAAAREAKQFVKVEVEEETPLITIQDALKAESYHGNPDGYLLRQGDLEKGFSDSEKVVEGEVSLCGQYHFYLEPQSALAIPKDEGLLIYSSTQSPTNVVDHVTALLNLKQNHVDVRVGRIGGGFGGKQFRAGPIAAIASLGAHLSGSPVKLTLDRKEDMAFCPGRGFSQAKYRAGFLADGKINALDVDFHLSGGFSNDYSADITEIATLLMDSCYHIENIRVHGLCLKTNLGSNTSTRGFGKPQASAVVETVLDHGASVLEMDANNLRRRNLYQKGHHTITRTEIRDNVMASCWDRVSEKSDYEKLKAEVDQYNRDHTYTKRGIAIVGSKGNMGFIKTDDINRGLALIHIQRDGTASVNHSGTEMGQGINTRMAQVAADTLGIPLESVEITDTQSGFIPNTPPTSMVSTDLCGEAILLACNKLKETLSGYEGSYEEKVHAAYLDGKSLTETGVHNAPRLAYDYEKQQGDISYFFVWGAATSVVEIDVLSGHYRIVKSNIVQDCGKSLNPLLDIGQAEGGFLYGVGYYMTEEMIYDKKGHLISNNVSSYKIPGPGDVPLDWDIELLNHDPNQSGLHNSKGIGEANVQLGLSVYFATKEAIRAARLEQGLSGEFSLNFPASVDRVCAALPEIETLL